VTPKTRRHVLLAPVGIWLALMLLLGLTLGYAYWPGAPGHAETGLAIGALKGLMIAVFFMQLRRAAGLVRLAAIAGLVWLSFLYLFAFADFLSR
jgi:cytochrome c oxidase subunit IV